MSTLINWTNTDNLKEIELTVGLPVFNGKKIIWLALESLKNQKDINFGWELIIWEEDGKSKSMIESFTGQLPNCQRIIHKSLPNKIPLVEKWLGIVEDSSLSSKIFVMKACDVYSPSNRLNIHYQHFQDEDCYLSTQSMGLFYNLNTKEKMFYIDTRRINHISMAYRTADFKKIKRSNISIYIDSYIRKNIEQNTKKSKVLFDTDTDNDNWKTGLDTDGANSISIYRKKFYKNTTFPFKTYEYRNRLEYESMEKYIPKNVIKFLEEYKIV